MKRLGFFVLLSILFSANLFAAPGEFPKKVFKHLYNFGYNISDKFVSTIQGTYHTSINYKFSKLSDNSKLEKHDFYLNSFHKEFKNLRVYLNSDVKEKKVFKPGKKGSKSSKKKTYHPKRSKLVFFISGLFDQATSGNTKAIIRHYLENGFHVVSIPNPASIRFIKAVPKHYIGDIFSEARATYELMQQTFYRLHRRGLVDLNQIHLGGLSHGAFTAAVIAAIDSSQKRPIITKDVKLLSPPYNFLLAAKNLDKALVESYDYSTHLFDVFAKILRIGKFKSDDEITYDDSMYAKAIVSHSSFKKGLIEAIKEFDERTGAYDVPKGEEYKRWKEWINFSNYLDYYIPEIKKQLRGSKGKLTHWIKIFHRNSGRRVQVLSTNDDFLNDGMRCRGLLPKRQLICLPYGGHMGYLYESNWFSRYMNIVLD